jgi:gamma-tubulin complex component 2
MGLLEPESIQKKVLMTGRYWNALRFCQADDDNGATEDQTEGGLHYGMDLSEISSVIDKLHSGASEALLRYLLQECQLFETLLMMKRYFLLEQGDFLVHFLDVAEAELLKDVEDVAVGRVQNWLGLSIQLASHHGDYLGPSSAAIAKEPLSTDCLSFKLAPGSLIDALDDLHAAKGGIDVKVTKTPSRHPYGLAANELTGLEAFVIDYPEVPFPTSLVISNHSLESYQLLFRHLFFAKHVERRLVGIWFDHQMMKELQSLRGSLGPTYSLRQRMLHFMQNLIYFMMSEVVGPNWSAMLEAITSDGMHSGGIHQNRVVQTVDDIICLHSEFLQRTCEGCLLTNRKLVRSLTKLMTTCRMFSDQMKRFMEKTKIVSDTASEQGLKEHRLFLTKHIFLAFYPAGLREPASCKPEKKYCSTQLERSGYLENRP